jgi:peptidyl-prolyl cis-trans isomerase D
LFFSKLADVLIKYRLKMALLGTIRNRFGWVMMALIFIGMASFLFMDIAPGGNTPSTRSTIVGYVNDEKVSNDLVQKYAKEYQGNQLLSEQIDEYVWERVVREKLMDDKTYRAGMMVSPVEMGDLLMSNDPSLLSPVIKQYFGDSKRGGAVNVEDIKQRYDAFHNTKALLNQANNDQRKIEELLEQQQQWFSLEESIEKNRLHEKFFKAIDRSVYTPAWMVELEQKNQKAGYNFDYVRIPYSNINDAIEVSDKEITNYIASHPRQYKRAATATINYLVFDVLPTSEDSLAYLNEMSSYATEFAQNETSKLDSNLIARQYGTFATNYYTKTEMTEPKYIIDSIFDAEDGAVFGPFLHNKQYRVVKKIEQKELPDSVKARHILIRAQTPQEGQVARIKLDSLKELLQTDKNASFDSLALQFSEDGSKTSGGDLGWKAKDGSFVPQFEEYMFYTGKKDSLRILYTQFGLHLIQITNYKYETDKQGVRIATISKDIIPGAATTENKEREVIEFITESRSIEQMKTAAKEKGFSINTASSLEKGGYNIEGIGQNATAAEIIKWAHDVETTEGEVTNRPYSVENEELNCTDKYVVTALVSRASEGLASLEDSKVKGDVDRIIRNQKKTDLVKSKLSKLTSLEAIAAEFSVIKETATNVVYESAYIGAIGAEPKVAALASITEAGALSKAVGGKEGVYILELTSKTAAPPVTNVAVSRTEVSRKLGQLISQQTLFNEIKENAEVIDERSSY